MDAVKVTFWKIPRCGNVLETSNRIRSTLDSQFVTKSAANKHAIHIN